MVKNEIYCVTNDFLKLSAACVPYKKLHENVTKILKENKIQNKR